MATKKRPAPFPLGSDNRPDKRRLSSIHQGADGLNSRGATSRTRLVLQRPYLLPRCAASEAEDRRLYNLDIGDMTPAARWAEHEAANAALAAVIRSGRDIPLVYGTGETMLASAWLASRVAHTGGRP